MRRCVLIVFLISFLLFLTCTKEYTRLNLQIGEQPKGGSQVTEVTIVIVARLENGDTPIQIMVKGWSQDIYGQNETEYNADTWTFRETEWQEFKIILSAPAGYILFGYFWFEIVWEDEDGTENQVFSDTAYCYQ